MTMNLMKNLVCPSGMIFLFYFAGAIFLIFKKRKTGLSLIVSSGFLYIFFGFGPVSYWLMGNLEYRYPAIHSLENLQEIRWIVVLAGYAERAPAKPVSSEVNEPSAYRVIEAKRISRQIPEAGIIVSGFQ